MHAYTRGSQSLVHNDAHLLCKCRQVPDIIQYQTFEWEGSQKNGLSPTYLLKIAVHVAPASLLFLVGDKLQFCVLVPSPLLLALRYSVASFPGPEEMRRRKSLGMKLATLLAATLRL